MGSYTYTREEEKQIIGMYVSGMSNTDISRKIGRTTDAIEKKLGRLKKEGRLPEIRRPIPNSPYPVLGEDGDVLVSEGDALVISDLEVPFHHADFVNRVIDLALKWGIDTLHLDGDLLHYESLGRWGASWTSAQESDADKLSEFLLEIDDENLRAKGISLMEELNAFKDKMQPDYQTEINAARKAFATINEFDNVLVGLGNHDDRYLKTLDKMIDAKELLHQIGKGGDKKWKISKYYYTKLRTEKGEYRITHQRGSGANVAMDLCAQFHTHVLCGHSHRWSMQKDRSGKLWAIQMGHSVDERRLAYVQTRDARRDSHALGACIVKNGNPIMLHEHTDWEAMKRLY